MTAAAITRDNLRLLLASKRDVAKLAAVGLLLSPADGQPAPAAAHLLAGLFVRVKFGQYELALVRQLAEVESKPALAVQLPYDEPGPDGELVQVQRRVPLITVSGTNPLDDANWEALGRAELERLAAYMQRHGCELPLEEAAAAAWRKRAALEWHTQHGSAPVEERQRQLPALQERLADAAGIAAMRQQLEAVETSPRRQQVAFTVLLPEQRVAAVAAAAAPPPAEAQLAPPPRAAAAAVAAAAPRTHAAAPPMQQAAAPPTEQAVAQPPRRQVEYQPPPLQPALAYQAPLQAAELPLPAAAAPPLPVQQAVPSAGVAAFQTLHIAAVPPLSGATAVQRHVTLSGSSQGEGALASGQGQQQRQVSTAGRGLKISVSGLAAEARAPAHAAVGAAPPQQAQQLGWQPQLPAQQWEQPPLPPLPPQQVQQWEQPLLPASQNLEQQLLPPVLPQQVQQCEQPLLPALQRLEQQLLPPQQQQQQQRPHWVQHSAGGEPQLGQPSVAFELPPHLRGLEASRNAMQPAPPHATSRRPLADLLAPSVPAYTSVSLPGIERVGDAEVALASAARQAVQDSPAAAAQRALLEGLLRQQLKPHGGKRFRQFSATYKEAIEIMAQASKSSVSVKNAYNSYPGRRLDGLLVDLASSGLLSVAGQGSEPTVILLHVDQLASIHLSRARRQPGTDRINGSVPGGGDRRAEEAGTRGRPRKRSRSPERQQQEPKQGASMEPRNGKGGSRSRSRSADAGRPPPGPPPVGTFRGLPEDALLVPVRLQHITGAVEWHLCGTNVFVSGIGKHVDRHTALRHLRALFTEAGAEVVRGHVEGGDHRGCIAFIRTATAAQAARCIEQLQHSQFLDRRIFLQPEIKRVRELRREWPQEAAAAERALAICVAQGEHGQPTGGHRNSSRDGEREPGHGSQERGKSRSRSRSRSRPRKRSRSRGRSRGHSLERQTGDASIRRPDVSRERHRSAGPRQGGSRSRSRARNRRRSSSPRTGPAQGAATFRGLPEDAPLVPVRLKHMSGLVDWRLCSADVFVSGLGYGDRPALQRRLEGLFKGAGAAVTSAQVLEGDARGRIAYVNVRTAAQAARAIEQLQQRVLIDSNRLFLRPMDTHVRRLQQSCPRDAVVAAQRTLAACAAQEQQRGRPSDALRGSSSPGRQRSRSRERRDDPGKSSRGGRRSGSRSGDEEERGKGSPGKKRSRSRSSGVSEQQRQRRRRSWSSELATPERSPSLSDTAEQPGRGASQTPKRSPQLE